MIRLFARKATAIKHLAQGQILCNKDISKYFILSDYEQFQQLIETQHQPSYYEFLPEDAYVNLFLDIEIYKDKAPEHYELANELVQGIKDCIYETYDTQNLQCNCVVIESHEVGIKKSFHVIVRGKSKCEKEEPYYFKGVKSLKPIINNMFRSLAASKIVDLSVYREGLFRTYKSTKSGENRPLVKSTLSDPFDFLDTFVCHCPNASSDRLVQMSEPADIKNISRKEIKSEEVIEVIHPVQKDLTEEDKDIIRKFVRKTYKYRGKDIRDIILNHELNCINVNLHDTFCFHVDREHKSNHQYIVIDTYSSKQKCHDSDCKDFKHNEIEIANFPKEVNEIILKCLTVNKKEQELIEKAIQECKDYITKNFDENIHDIQFDRNEMVFKGSASNTNMIIRGQCTSCKLEHHITNNGYCLKCGVCNAIYPKNQLIPVEDRYKNLNSFWMNYNQLVNNGTVNISIINNYSGEEEFSCDIQLDNSIFKNKELTKLYNQILDGHKVVLISQLMSKLEVDFKYTNGEWYFFNGSIWKHDKESLEFRKRIVKLSNNFSHIQSYYESKSDGVNSNSSIIKNIKSLVNKLHKTGFEDEVTKGAKMYYNDEHFIRNLNSKKHLLPFHNGVYDLLSNKFRKTAKEDYVNLTVNYEYKPEVRNIETVEFVNKVLPNPAVRDYVIKKLSECLNGDIPNTNFLMFIGDGANGKSQLLNLMKLAIGELGEKVEVTLLTRKRTNANEANTEKIKLMNKRFAFLSEPEDGEKINISLLKELTGSEEIVARGLYQESMSFVMEAKLFLACNELPEIKGEDTALWRRIRVIDFPSRFVDDPKDMNEYKIDRTLPSRMREDVTWRQTFMNLLLDYYNKDVPEPAEVKFKTNEYRQENNNFITWVEDNIRLKTDSVLNLKDILQLYLGKSVPSRVSSKYKKELEKYIKSKYPNLCDTYRDTSYNGAKVKGWIGLTLTDVDM